MKNTMGGRLAELIYTPGGAGIKNGQPYTYTGQVAADHFDHVHVAIDSGVPGVGDGIGRKRGTGDGLGFGTLESLWVRGGGSRGMAPLMAHIAQAESGGNPNARNPSGASGLWQILGQPFKGNVFDPLTNARMAVWKYAHQGLGAWGASRGTWGRYLNSGETYTGSTGTTRTGPTASRGAASAPVDPNRIIGAGTDTFRPFTGYVPHPLAAQPSEEVQRARDFVNRTGAFAPSRPLKGGGPTKGFTDAEVEAGLNIRPEPATEMDYADAALAQAQASPGREDDAGPLQAIGDIWYREYQAALASGDPRRIAGARRGLTDAENAIRENREAIQANADADVEAGFTSRIARARLTDGLADDLDAYTALRDRRKAAMDTALADANPGNDADAIDAYLQTVDAIKSLEETMKANTEAAEAETKARDEQRKAYETLMAQDYQRQFNVSQSQYGALAQAVADAANGQLGQRVGLSMAGLTFAAGSVNRL
jgi:hypothetical protein